MADDSRLPSVPTSANNVGQPVGSPANGPATPSTPARDQVPPYQYSPKYTSNRRSDIALSRLQSRSGDKPLNFQVIFPQNGTAVVKGLKQQV